MDANLRTPSVLDAIESALHHTRRICFEPFDLSKWFLLGFCAFLAQLAQAGGGYTGGNPFGAMGKGSATDTWLPWVTSRLAFVLVVLQLVIRDFVVPIMYERGTGAVGSLIVFRVEVLRGRVVPILLF